MCGVIIIIGLVGYLLFNKLNKDNYYIADIDNIDISSTYIRENIHNYSLIKDMIDYRVYEYYKGITC